jgi:glycosyltransferase involved in cell wall biosynthesis
MDLVPAGTPVELRIVGEGGERPWLERNVRHAVFHGVLQGERLAEAYASMDLLLFPSETDTFGNVVLEAAASGVPAAVSACGGPKYLVRPEETGFVARSAAEFASAVTALAADPARRAKMGQAARAKALSRSWDAVFEGVYDCYRGALPGDTRRISGTRSKQTFRPRTVS